ncbi:MAG TPA: NAD(P)H-dependent oxidoreductase [Bacteroidota bacterium]|nr:NAD(P)H-dependent oxidoreductase [Bacteroidota bacterium]
MNSLHILAIPGSLRTRSFNRSIAKYIASLSLQDASVEVFELNDIPPFNADIEKDLPQSVKLLKEKLKSADAVLICTPEYNYSIPGVLKNAIDWGTRPGGDNSWSGKPVAIMGASTGRFGTARAQYHLRQILVTLNMYALNRPEVMITEAPKKFDAEGNITDEETRKRIGDLLDALIRWTRALKQGGVTG